MTKENGLEYEVFKEGEQEFNIFEEFVQKHIFDGISNAVARLKKEEHGDGCGCLNCTRTAMDKANALIDFVADDDETARHYHFYLVFGSGTFKVVQGNAARDQWTSDHREDV